MNWGLFGLFILLCALAFMVIVLAVMTLVIGSIAIKNRLSEKANEVNNVSDNLEANNND